MAESSSIVELIEEPKGDILVIRIKGRLDSVSSPAAETKVLDLIAKGQRKIILEISGTNYISSAGMRLLLTATKKIRALSGKICICSMPPNVFEVLKMSGFDHILDLYLSEEEAMRNF